MTVLDSIKSWLGFGTQYENVVFSNPSVANVMGLSAEELYRTQPHLRTVVSFVARNIAHLPLQAFERTSDTDRTRSTDSTLARVLKRPNADQTQFELMTATVSDLKIYDYAVWTVTEVPESPTGWDIRAIPPSWIMRTGGGSSWMPQWIEVANPAYNGRVVRVEREQFIVFHGYSPGDPARGASPVDTLRQILAEQIQAWSFREQVWQRGGRVGTYLTRPANAPDWSSEAQSKFHEDWKAKWTGPNGAKAGGTPLLQDGMELKTMRFNAREEEWSEVAKLALSTVASVYHVNPTMIGVLDNANYSNVMAFKQALYTETLGPDLAMFEDRINTFLLPMLGASDTEYVEFNIAEKLQGSFEEQAAVISTSVGRPWMTADEARSRFNMSALGGDAEHLVTPLNVLVGGQASPQDGVTSGGGGGSVDDSVPVVVPEPSDEMSGDEMKKRVEAAAALIRAGFEPAGALEAVGLDPIKHLGLLPITVQKPLDPDGNVDEAVVTEVTSDNGAKSGPIATRGSLAESLHLKAAARAEDARAVEQVLARHFRRQRGIVLSALGAKADTDWWDAERWNRELSDDLFTLSMSVTADVADDVLTTLGIDPKTYDTARTAEFLKAVADSRAEWINKTTRAQIEKALSGGISDDAEMSTPAGVFDVAESVRSEQSGVTIATTLAAFAVTEAARQAGRPSTTKTWVVTSSNPRPSHARMNGQTVAIDARFSNGMDWPGDPINGAGEVANCRCVVDITMP